jgi:hypothetical protein
MLLLVCILSAVTAAQADPITVTTTAILVDTRPTLNSITFTGATPGDSFELLCLCPNTSSLGTGTVDINGIGSLDELLSDATGQTSFFIQIGNLSYGRFGVLVTNLSLTGQTTQPECTPEPATMVLLGTGLAGVAIKTRRRFKRHKRNEGGN